MSLAEELCTEVCERLELASMKQRYMVLTRLLELTTPEQRDGALIWLLERDAFMSLWLANRAIAAEVPPDLEYERAAEKERREFRALLDEMQPDHAHQIIIMNPDDMPEGEL